jgi:hypothetical protein
MPRNIEYSLDQHIYDKDIPLLVLTLAIKRNLDVPNFALETFDSRWGIDNHFFLQRDKNYIELIKNAEERLQKLRSLEFTYEAIEIEKHLHLKEYKEKYETALTNYNETLKQFSEVRETLLQLITSNEKQATFKNTIIKTLDDYSSEIKNNFETKYPKPRLELHDEVLWRLRVKWEKEIDREREFVERCKLNMLFDDAFYREILNDWFEKK